MHEQPNAAPGAAIRINSSGPGPRLMTANTLEGNAVINQADETLGTITDIMLDVPQGRIAYAVMTSGSFLGMAGKLFALPWNLLTLDTERKCFICDIAKETISNAPGFDKDHWPDVAELGWQQDVHSYYGTQPHWEKNNHA